ncbi:MAG TPA: hypothetical protein VGO62_13825, partial [Myxococcota bacterium]
MRSHVGFSIGFGICFAAITIAGGARAQGVPDPRTGIVLPNSQSAAVEDATSILVNPAGLANLEGLEVNLGGFLRTDGRVGQSDVDGIVALAPGSGIGLGVGAGLTLPDGKLPRLRTTAGLGLGERTASIGIALHAISEVGGGARPDWLVDLGAQLRPSRWLAFGVGVNGLGDQNLGPASGRIGLSLRPIGEALTVGVDAQIIPGTRNPTSTDYENFTVVPGAVARLELGGIAFTLGASVSNLAVRGGQQPNAEVLAGIELNGETLGLSTTGGVGGLGSDDYSAVGGVRIRTSSAAYPGLFPDSGRWVSLSLTGDGVPVDEGRGFLHSLFGDKPQALGILTALHNLADDESVDGIVIRL